jgi:PASTA domain
MSRLLGRVALLTAVTVLSFMVGSSIALADLEPNDGITQAEGPLVGGTVYTGTVDQVDDPFDLDTYVFYAKPYQQIDIHVTLMEPSDDYDCLQYEVADSDNDGGGDFGSGETIDAGEMGNGDECQSSNTSDDLQFTSSGMASRYYLQLECSGSTIGPGCQTPLGYAFDVTPISAVIPGPATLRPQQTGEPNENARQAIGPLSGNVAYAGEIQTPTDQDWFRFTTAPGTHRVDFAFTEPVDPPSPYDGPVGGCYGADIDLLDSRGRQVPNQVGVDGTNVYLNEWLHDVFTSYGRQTYFVKAYDLNGCYPDNYEFVLEPASAISQAAPVRCVVPRLPAHDPLSAAESAVLKAHCSFKKVRRIFSSTVPNGDVIRLMPAAGRRLRNGASVTIVVSKGRPCVVPSARGETLRTAEALLHEANCRPGRVRWVFSTTVRRGRVVGLQFPAGARLASRKHVAIAISRGRRRG